MPQLNFAISFIAFLSIWSFWSIWAGGQPVLSNSQIIILFPFLSISVLLLAFALFDDDDDGGGGKLQPIYQRIRY